MLTVEQLVQIDEKLRSGVLPEQVAKDMGLASATLRYQLLRSGRQIAIYRRIECINPVPAQRELSTAA